MIASTETDFDECVGTAADDPAAVPPAPGAGLFLLAIPVSDACAGLELSVDREFAIFWDRSGDTLWIDDDGDWWGLFWHRARG